MVMRNRPKQKMMKLNNQEEMCIEMRRFLFCLFRISSRSNDRLYACAVSSHWSGSSRPFTVCRLVQSHKDDLPSQIHYAPEFSVEYTQRTRVPPNAIDNLRMGHQARHRALRTSLRSGSRRERVSKAQQAIRRELRSVRRPSRTASGRTARLRDVRRERGEERSEKSVGATRVKVRVQEAERLCAGNADWHDGQAEVGTATGRTRTRERRKERAVRGKHKRVGRLERDSRGKRGRVGYRKGCDDGSCGRRRRSL